MHTVTTLVSAVTMVAARFSASTLDPSRRRSITRMALLPSCRSSRFATIVKIHASASTSNTWSAFSPHRSQMSGSVIFSSILSENFIDFSIAQAGEESTRSMTIAAPVFGLPVSSFPRAESRASDGGDQPRVSRSDARGLAAHLKPSRDGQGAVRHYRIVEGRRTLVRARLQPCLPRTALKRCADRNPPSNFTIGRANAAGIRLQ